MVRVAPHAEYSWQCAFVFTYETIFVSFATPLLRTLFVSPVTVNAATEICFLLARTNAF